jgi:hypothetical protein
LNRVAPVQQRLGKCRAAQWTGQRIRLALEDLDAVRSVRSRNSNVPQ